MRRDKLNKFAVNRLFAEGNAAKGRWMVVRAAANALPYSRFTAVAPRKTGCAVVRNLVKRRLRAVWNLEHDAMPTGYDFAVIARREVADADFAELAAMLVKTAQNAAAAPSVPAHRPDADPDKGGGEQHRRNA